MRAARWMGTTSSHRWALENRLFVQPANKEVVMALCINCLTGQYTVPAVSLCDQEGGCCAPGIHPNS